MKNKLIGLLEKIVGHIKNIPIYLKGLLRLMGFFLLLIFYFASKIFTVLKRIPVLGRVITSAENKLWADKLEIVYKKTFARIDNSKLSEVKRSYLIELAIQNLLVKKTRTFITILGMSVGVGIIVLLLSLGYGVERLVISKVAGLDELKMVDVSLGENTAMHLDQNMLTKIQKIKNVQKVAPLASLVGKITYNKASTDIIVYASTKDFLDFSKLKLSTGKLFSMGDKREYLATNGMVAGVSDTLLDGKYGVAINNNTINFNIIPKTSVDIWKDCSISSALLGYTMRVEGGDYRGVEYWGDTYSPFANHGRTGFDKTQQRELGTWIKAKVPLYDNTDGKIVPSLDDSGRQKWIDGCLETNNIVKSEEFKLGKVLGESTSSATLTSSLEASSSSLFETVNSSTSSGGLEIVQLIPSTTQKKTGNLKFNGIPSGEAVVSKGMLSLLNIPLDKAMGTKFYSAFIITKSLKPDVNGRVLTDAVEYEIIGVIDDTTASYFFIPLSDMDKLGIKNYSQFKVVLSDKESLPKVRKEIEAFGLRTTSAVDTVNQIESIFANLRIVLAILGLVALGVASLGMFNTLTVSLLERTREIGGMKAMGMISSEVQDLFLAEAMIMGLSGGIGGLALGWSIGHLLSLGLSVLSVTKGQGYLNLTYIPSFLIVFIVVCAFIVGIVTGLYPANRAKKMSALNALRYE